jgi:hypothetical protein
MENMMSIKALEAELKGFLKKEYQKNSSYQTYSPVLNPKIRFESLKTNQESVCAEALIKLLKLIAMELSVVNVFHTVLKIPYEKCLLLTTNDIEKNIPQILPKKLIPFHFIKLIIGINYYGTKLEKELSNFDCAVVTLKAMVIYITIHDFSFKEILLLGLKNEKGLNKKI